MTKEEFFTELEECLSGEVNDAEYTDSVSYYRDYIRDEVASGKTEDEVIKSLGSPRLIARSIIDARGIHSDSTDQYEDVYGNQEEIYDENGEQKTSIFQSEGFQKAKFIVILLAILLVVGFLFIQLLPVIIVLAVVAYIYRAFRS